MKKSTFYLLLFFCFAACSKKSPSSGSAKQHFEFEIIDSLDINTLGVPISSTISEGNLALYDFPSKEILITDLNGTITHRINKKEDSPDAFGFMMELPILWGDKHIIIIGLNGIFIYDLDGNMVKKIDHPEPLGGAGFMAFPGKTAKIITIEEKDYLLMKSLRSRDTFNGEQKFYNTYKAVELVDLATGEMRDFGPFEEGSRFLDGKGYIGSDYAPAFEISHGKLYLAHGAEPKIYSYDFNTKEAILDTVLTLAIPDFLRLEGVDRSELSEGTITINGGTPAIRKIEALDGKLLIHYYAGFDPEKAGEVEELWAAGKDEEATALYQKKENEVAKGILIYDEQTLAYLGEISFPDKMNNEGFINDGAYLWLEKNRDKEVEEDFLRIYKVNLKTK